MGNELEVADEFYHELAEKNDGAVECFLLQESLRNLHERKWTETEQNATVLKEKTWERMHLGPWKNISPLWRRCYAYSTIILSKCYESKNDHKEALRLLDMGLLMSGPTSNLPFHENIDRILKVIQLNSEIGVECSQTDKSNRIQNKRRKIDALASKVIDISKQIRRICVPSLNVFLNSHMKPKVPVIIEDAMNNWPALGTVDSSRAWSNFDYLRKIAGHRTVPIEIGESYLEDEWGQSLLTLNEFIDKYILNTSTNGTSGYLAQHELFQQIPSLRRDIIIPDYCALSSREDSDDDVGDVIINAWFGPAHTISPLHHDPYENLLCQVVGSKYIRLYHSDDSNKLYPVEGLLSNTSQVTVEDVDESRFPLFKEAPYTECILQPGEMLYIPPKFWHYIKSLQVSFSVSLWWS